MTFKELLKELGKNEFKVIEKDNAARLIKNKKAITYTEQEWESLSIKSKAIQLQVILNTFS